MARGMTFSRGFGSWPWLLLWPGGPSLSEWGRGRVRGMARGMTSSRGFESWPWPLFLSASGLVFAGAQALRFYLSSCAET